MYLVVSGLAPLSAPTALFILVDVDPQLMLPHWEKTGATAARLQVVDPSGTRECLLIASTPAAPRWIIIADELGIGIVQQGLQDDGRVEIAAAEQVLSDVSDLNAILTHLLATESFFDLGGFGLRPTFGSGGRW